MALEPALVAYWGSEKDVLYTEMPERHPLFGVMQTFIVEGHVLEVLDYYPETPGLRILGDRCEYWREQLREQGYEVSRPMEGA